ncbi:MAG: OmpP1/FadL family transporter [Planctomycetota bacterium]|jgi:long-chain fatty acid transport protein
MRRIAGTAVTAVVSAAAGLLVAATPAAASGLESHGIGARGRGMCSAMVAVADDWTAIHYNPAGLVQIEGRVLGVDYDLFVGAMESTKSLRNLTAGANPMRGDFIDPIGDEPASFNEDSGGATIHSGELGYATSWGRIAFGVGVYGSGSGAGWEDTIPTALGDTIDAEITFQNASVNVPICLAYQATPDLSVGLRLAVHYGMLVADNNKYRSGAISPYTSATSQDTDGVGVSVDLGMLWKASERFALGAVVKLPHTFEKSGETKTVQSLMGTAASPDTTVEESYPLRIALGCAYRPDDVNLLAFDVTWLDWSEYNMRTEYSPQIPAAGLVNMSGNFADWRDAVVLNLGYERRLNDRWTFRCGVGYDEAPEPTGARTLVGGQVLDLWKFAVGAGVEWDRTTLAFGYTHMHGPEVDGYVPGAKYSMSLHELYVGLERRF